MVFSKHVMVLSLNSVNLTVSLPPQLRDGGKHSAAVWSGSCRQSVHQRCLHVDKSRKSMTVGLYIYRERFRLRLVLKRNYLTLKCTFCSRSCASDPLFWLSCNLSLCLKLHLTDSILVARIVQTTPPTHTHTQKVALSPSVTWQWLRNSYCRGCCQLSGAVRNIIITQIFTIKRGIDGDRLPLVSILTDLISSTDFFLSPAPEMLHISIWVMTKFPFVLIVWSSSYCARNNNIMYSQQIIYST